MARPRRYPDCPECGWGPLRVLQTKRRSWCVVRYAVCDSCGRRFRFVTVEGAEIAPAPEKADTNRLSEF